MDKDILLVRYQTLAANRRHFSSLYFGVVAFSWSFGLATWFCLHLTEPAMPSAAFCAAGSNLLAGAFVANRLLQRERGSFDAMCNAWKNISGDNSAGVQGFRPGAMAVVVVGQVIAGFALLAMSAMTFFRW
jgi:hypothetical protein